MATEVVSREAQREHPRWPVTSAKAVRVDLGPAGSGQIVDISAGGMRVKLLAPLRRDAEIPVRIDVPDKPNPVQCSGVVVWSKPNGAAGIRFTKISDEHKATLTSWLAALEQAASESSPQRDEFARITAQLAAMKLNNADALSLIARRVSQLGSASGVTIALGKAENMICLARAGEAPDLGTLIRPASGLIGECVRGRKLVLVHDASTDPRAGELKQGSALILPLLVNTELRGVLQVVCPQAHSFDTKTIELMQKLADAVIFVTHNIMPQQRRLATVTPLTKAAPSATSANKPAEPLRVTPLSAPPMTKPSDSGRMPAYSAPPLGSPSDTGRMAAYTTPLKPVTPISPAMPSIPAAQSTSPLSFSSERSSTIEIAPLAEPVRSPIATAAAPRAAFEVVRPVATRTAHHEAMSEPLPTFHPRSHSSNKVGIFAVVAVVLVVASVGFYFWHGRQQHAVVIAAAAATTAPVSSATESTVTVTPEVKPASTTNSSFVPSPVAKTSAEPQHVAEKPSADKKTASPEPAPSAPAPMVLAAARPVERMNVEEPDSAAPSATQLAIHTTPAIPGIALPSTTSAPKLSAPVAKTWTGGTLLQRLPPIYPQPAINRGIEGPVQLVAMVTSKGTVDKVRIVSGNPILAQAAMDAVKRWRYEPFKADGVPTDKEVSITLNFKIPR